MSYIVSLRIIRTAFLCCALCAAIHLPTAAVAGDPLEEDKDGIIHLPALSLPESSLLSEETRAALNAAREAEDKDARGGESCPSIETATNRTQAAAIHKCEEGRFKASSFYTRLRSRYSVDSRQQEFGDVHAEIFTPAEGVSSRNRSRVLINVHGGGFLGGWGTNSALESIPIASVAKIKVISIDYREAPEDRFPAASEDVINVYRTLLKTYPAKNIGIYGCSAGALLAAESVALLLKRNLPAPGGLGMFCGGASYYSEGDSGYVGRVVYSGTAFERMVWGNPTSDNPYFKNVDLKDPLAFPVASPSLMARFPPTLVIAGIRDPALSSAVHTHSVLVAQGVEADLHVWEGLGHAFFYDTNLPESRAVYTVTANFFASHLGK